MASAIAVGDVVVLPFSAQARGIQLYKVDCRHLVIRNPVVVRRNVSQNDESRTKRVTCMWLWIKMAFSPYVLNMRIAVFDFLWEIMSPFDVKDARKRPHWWVWALLCCKLTNALWYLSSLLFILLRNQKWWTPSCVRWICPNLTACQHYGATKG